jgi:hypothetical protein
MIEAVENHMPEVIVIDEIGTEAEALAARTIAERGVQLIATAHGNSLDNLLMNPTLADLLGGIHSVTLGDEEARRRGTQKTVLERKAPPTFDTLVEIRTRDEFSLFHDTAMRFCAAEQSGRKCGFAKRSAMRSLRLKSYPENTNDADARAGAVSTSEQFGRPNPIVLRSRRAGRRFESIRTVSAATGFCVPQMTFMFR